MSSASTPTSSTSATASGDPGGGGGGGNFFTAGGSTLILAFLAIGLFVGGLLVMFSMRRYMLTSRRRIRAWHGEEGERRSVDWDEVEMDAGPSPFLAASVRRRRRREIEAMVQPRLWEYHSRHAKGAAWDRIQPLAAKLDYGFTPACEDRHTANSRDGPSSGRPRPGFLHPFQIGLQDVANQFSSLRPSPRTPARPPSPRPLFSPTSNEARSATTSTPPSPTYPSYVNIALAVTFPEEKPRGTGVPLFALGVGNVRWSGGPLESPRHDATPALR